MSSHDEPIRSCVLHVSITHLIYPVTEKVLGQIFDVYGVNDLCLFQQPTHLDVFVEFQSCHEASQARGALHGRCIYDGCCLLDIQHAPPSISVHRLPNSEPVVVDWDRVEVEPLAFSSTPSASTPAIMDKALDCEVLVALLTPHEASTSAATNTEEARQGGDVFRAPVGCIIMAPTSCSTVCPRENSDKRITQQLPMHGPTVCPPPSLCIRLCAGCAPDRKSTRLNSSHPV